MNQRRSQTNATMEAGQAIAPDCGRRALDLLFDSMMIDECWSTREERAFQWWGQGVAQRAWAEPPREDLGEPVSLVHVETDFLRNVEDSDKTYEELNRLQTLSALCAFIYLPSEKKIRMHSTAYLHEGNYSWISRLLLNVAGLQLLTASDCPGLKVFFEGAEPDITAHPVNGYRESVDELIEGLIGFYSTAYKTPLKVPRGGFKEVCRLLKGFNVLAFSGKAGLTAEFHFVGDHPALARQMAGKTGVETSLYKALVDEKHVIFGHGLTSLLTLPVEKQRVEGLRWCNSMNLLESREWTGFHLLGAWSTTPHDENSVLLVHGGFLPAFPVQPELVLNLALANGLRSKWASSRLGYVGGNPI